MSSGREPADTENKQSFRIRSPETNQLRCSLDWAETGSGLLRRECGVRRCKKRKQEKEQGIPVNVWTDTACCGDSGVFGLASPGACLSDTLEYKTLLSTSTDKLMRRNPQCVCAGVCLSVCVCLCVYVYVCMCVCDHTGSSFINDLHGQQADTSQPHHPNLLDWG